MFGHRHFSSCASVRGAWQNSTSTLQKLRNHPNFKRNTLGVKRPFLELLEISEVFSEQLSLSRKCFSECSKIHFSECHLTT